VGEGLEGLKVSKRTMADRTNWDRKREFAPAPEPLKFRCVDVHAHLEIVTETAPDSPEIEALLDAAARVGIDRVVQVGISADQAERCVQMADAFPGRVLAAVALHPNDAPISKDLEADLAVIEKLASHPRVRAIGETGLDFFRTEPELQEKQKYSFRRHIDIAKRHDLALVIHDRDAHRAVLDALLEEGAPKVTIFHCYSGDEEMARECIDAGYIVKVGWNNTLLQNAGVFTPADTATATSSTGDVRGTFAPTTASDGIKRLVMTIALPGIAVGPNATRTGALGVTQA